METLTGYSQKALIKTQIVKDQMIEKAKNFNKEETSATQTSETGVLTYIGVTLGILVGAIGIAYGEEIFTAIMELFKTGTSKTPTGWE